MYSSTIEFQAPKIQSLKLLKLANSFKGLKIIRQIKTQLNHNYIMYLLKLH